MKIRPLEFAALLVAAGVLALCAHVLKIAFQELGAAVKSPAAPVVKQTTESSQPMKTEVPAPPPAMAHEAATAARIALPYPAPPEAEKWQTMPAAERLSDVRRRLLPRLNEELAAKECRLGQPVFVRLFKESRELEVWMQDERAEWRLFRTYPIVCFSGTLGPKTKEGDMQAPEGFYNVTARMLNPASRYHLSFNVGYPNAYDVAHGRTGNLIMVHGDVCSIGCFAMTDAVIEEIYLVVEAALKDGGSVPVHCFPFRMTAERMGRTEAEHVGFWQELLPVYEVFEMERRVVRVEVEKGRYQVW